MKTKIIKRTKCLLKVLPKYLKQITFLVIASITLATNGQTINIASGADMKYIMPELIAMYQQQNPNVKFNVLYGSTGMFYEQILLGAGYDLFFSDNISFAQKLYDKGFTEENGKTFAYNSMVLWAANIDVSKGFSVLNDQKVKRVAIANPQYVPLGESAIECLKYYNIYNNIANKIIVGDNINQAANYAATEMADIAVISMSLAMAPQVASQGHFYKINPLSYHPIEQSCAQIKHKNKALNAQAQQFMQFVLSKQCKPVFEKFGYEMPNDLAQKESILTTESPLALEE